MITYSDFQKLDIRIGTIESAERVPEADKLLKLTVNLGRCTSSEVVHTTEEVDGERNEEKEEPKDDVRQIMAGIAEYYEPESLVGKQVPILANLEPKKLRGYESQGMILAASDDDGKPILLNPSESISSGSRIK